MIPFRPFSGQTQACFVLFISSALAALQNVTVDDATLTGPVVPLYLPAPSNWNTGNNCTGCLVKPDSTLAYNGTWHDATYDPNNGYTQAIDFTFTGSALYIFFIMANNVSSATTFTNVEFVLDNVVVTQYVHTPGTTTDYQYNVPVFANGSLGSGRHDMRIQPVNSENNVLILFDYLIYSTDTTSSVSSSAMSTSPSASPTSSGTQGTSSGQNMGAIVGGVVGGVTALAVAIGSLVCYRRYKRRDSPLAEEGAVMEPFFPSVEVAPTSIKVATSSTHRGGFSDAEPAFGTGPSIATLLSSTPPASTTAPSSSGGRPSTDPALHAQVELLRGEVARLRDMHEAPPEYSTGTSEAGWTG